MSMAATFPLNGSKVLMLLALCMAFSFGETKQTKMTLYFQDFAYGPNASFVMVAGIPAKEWNYTKFGTVYATDNLMTVGPDINSPVVGRAQGMYVVSGLDGRNLLVLLSLVFTNQAYNGSTIEIQGTSRQFDPNRELAVVSGTGRFRLARGYATTNNYFFNIPTGYTVAQFNITMFQ